MKTKHPLSLNGMHHVSLPVHDMDRSLAFYRDVLGFSPKTSFLLDGLRFAMLETGNDVYIELVEMKQPMQPVGETEVFWHLALRTDHLEKLLEAAINAGFEVTVPMRPLDLVNEVTQKRWPVRVAFFRGPDGELIELLEDKTGYT
jgi:catechol 2,3-dioxygenase-like lactoylglutathione lyase family enzyme